MMISRTTLFTFLLTASVFYLGGCSLNDSDTMQPPQPSSRVLENTKGRPDTNIRPPNVVANRTVTVYKPNTPRASRSQQAKPAERVLTAKEQAAFNKALEQVEKSRREVSDPYASIPDAPDNTAKKTPGSHKPESSAGKSKSAVDSLILQARAEMMVGKYLSAESKIERGLRIAPENPELWTLLAKAHYGQANYSQAINMAKKAIQYSRNDDLTARNWQLIKKAGKKSGDAIAVKEAVDYMKTKP